ncbi:hypothetical protein quinque_014171 [Culex quinquefasciatus]
MNENESSMYAVQMTLVIRKLHKADMGGYKCISKNSIGDAEGTIRLYEMELQKKTKTAHRLNSVEDTSNDEINSTPNVDQPEETNKIHKNGRLYKGCATENCLKLLVVWMRWVMCVLPYVTQVLRSPTN